MNHVTFCATAARPPPWESSHLEGEYPSRHLNTHFPTSNAPKTNPAMSRIHVAGALVVPNAQGANRIEK